MQKQTQNQEQNQELRIHCISVRMNPAEYRELDRRRGKVQRGTFLRRLFLGKKEPAQIPEPNRKAYAETARAMQDAHGPDWRRRLYGRHWQDNPEYMTMYYGELARRLGHTDISMSKIYG